MPNQTPQTSSSRLAVKHIESIPTRHTAAQWDGTTEGAETLMQFISERSGRDTKSSIMSGMLLLTQGLAVYRLYPNDWVLLTEPSNSISIALNEFMSQLYKEVQE
ncbi:hypothetical protein [Glutamicibacter creatinolyticus]|uniref:hypothetical protein n=1 Tax=Glutamicibacter creatinolyticus TaxID=162496 RepID=UPI0032166FB6